MLDHLYYKVYVTPRYWIYHLTVYTAAPQEQCVLLVRNMNSQQVLWATSFKRKIMASKRNLSALCHHAWLHVLGEELAWERAPVIQALLTKMHGQVLRQEETDIFCNCIILDGFTQSKRISRGEAPLMIQVLKKKTRNKLNQSWWCEWMNDWSLFARHLESFLSLAPDNSCLAFLFPFVDLLRFASITLYGKYCIRRKWSRNAEQLSGADF
jgi:hypothetical protein